MIVVNVVNIRTVVDLPAPLGPRNPKISPRRTSRSTPRTASTVASTPVNVLARATALIALGSSADMPGSGSSGREEGRSSAVTTRPTVHRASRPDGDRAHDSAMVRVQPNFRSTRFLSQYELWPCERAKLPAGAPPQRRNNHAVGTIDARYPRATRAQGESHRPRPHGTTRQNDAERGFASRPYRHRCRGDPDRQDCGVSECAGLRGLDLVGSDRNQPRASANRSRLALNQAWRRSNLAMPPVASTIWRNASLPSSRRRCRN